MRTTTIEELNSDIEAFQMFMVRPKGRSIKPPALKPAPRETIFALTYFDQPSQYTYEPFRVQLPTLETSYTPDFLDHRNGDVIEVVGTRQAFSRNRLKYIVYHYQEPHINFRIFHYTGVEIVPPWKGLAERLFNPTQMDILCKALEPLLTKGA